MMIEREDSGFLSCLLLLAHSGCNIVARRIEGERLVPLGRVLFRIPFELALGYTGASCLLCLV